jgi:hypothetical protein
MGRPTKDIDQRRQAVTISLAPTDLVILDNLVRVVKTNRSKVISEMLVAKGFNDLGLSAIESHEMPTQNWPHKHQAKALGHSVYDADSARACNPAGMNGKCKHQSCQIVYRFFGVA